MKTLVSISQLEAQLQHFDGKHTDSLLRVAETLSPDGFTIDQLISLAERRTAYRGKEVSIMSYSAITTKL